MSVSYILFIKIWKTNQYSEETTRGPSIEEICFESWSLKLNFAHLPYNGLKNQINQYLSNYSIKYLTF
jgi:hypothetical protein